MEVLKTQSNGLYDRSFSGYIYEGLASSLRVCYNMTPRLANRTAKPFSPLLIGEGIDTDGNRPKAYALGWFLIMCTRNIHRMMKYLNCCLNILILM